jgi:hypothetical protein
MGSQMMPKKNKKGYFQLLAATETLRLGLTAGGNVPLRYKGLSFGMDLYY